MITALKVLSIIILVIVGLNLLILLGIIIYASAHRITLADAHVKINISDLLIELIAIAMSIIILCL